MTSLDSTGLLCVEKWRQRRIAVRQSQATLQADESWGDVIGTLIEHRGSSRPGVDVAKAAVVAGEASEAGIGIDARGELSRERGAGEGAAEPGQAFQDGGARIVTPNVLRPERACRPIPPGNITPQIALQEIASDPVKDGSFGRIIRRNAYKTGDPVKMGDIGRIIRRNAYKTEPGRAPELLLLDEPTAGVDPKARREFWEELHALAARGISILVSTHYMDEAERCHKLAYIAFGKLMAQGTAQQIVAAQRPGHLGGVRWRPGGDRGQAAGHTGCRADRRVRRGAARHRPRWRGARGGAAPRDGRQRNAHRAGRHRPRRRVHPSDEPVGRQLRGRGSETLLARAAGGASC